MYIFLVHKIVSSKISKMLDVISTTFLLLVAIVGFVYNVQMIQELV